MTDVIIVVAVVAGIAWLGVMLVSAFRNKGAGEEIAPNLRPGIDDQQLETRRLESGQKFAIFFSGFLAIALPLYFLGEGDRQEAFVEEFAHASEERGHHEVEEFACFSCHGPGGAGGAAAFVEQRSGVAVTWYAPPLNDIFYRYDREEVDFWITWGRANTPMPAWGIPGGGPMDVKQVEDVVNYLESIQVSQQEAVNQTEARVGPEVTRLRDADATVESAILNQRQVIAEIDQAPADQDFAAPLVAEAVELLATADEGIDTDADGLSDVVEQRLNEITEELNAYFIEVEPVTLDPNTPDRAQLENGLAMLAAAAEKDPIFESTIAGIEAAIDDDLIDPDHPDTDGDGLSDALEGALTGRFAGAVAATVPSQVSQPLSLDPTDAESSGQADSRAASDAVGGLQTLGINLGVLVDNVDRIRPQEVDGLAFLEAALESKTWEIDISGVASSMGVSEEEAERAVALFNANCARCHTAGYGAGVAFTLEAGSGGFGPALWDGRPLVQFGEAPDDPEVTDLLVDFLIKGSEPQKPYGLNGVGSGRMPAFGTTLSLEDLELLALYLRAGNLDGME